MKSEHHWCMLGKRIFKKYNRMLWIAPHSLNYCFCGLDMRYAFTTKVWLWDCRVTDQRVVSLQFIQRMYQSVLLGLCSLNRKGNLPWPRDQCHPQSPGRHFAVSHLTDWKTIIKLIFITLDYILTTHVIALFDQIKLKSHYLHNIPDVIGWTLASVEH